MLDIKNATGCSKQGTCVTASKLLQMFYCNSWNCPPILWPLPLYTLYTYTIYMCVCVCVLCEMVIKIVEMHLPLGCFVDFLWLRPGRNAPHAALSSMIEIATATETETAIATAVYALCEVQQCCLRSLKYLEACSNATDISHLYFVWFFSLSFPLSLSQSIYDCHVCGSCGFTFYTFKPYDVTAFPPLPYLELSVMRSLGIPAVGN